MCDIPNTILEKIGKCDVFLCDLTFVGDYQGRKKRKMVSSPNVQFELGYAAHAIGFDRVVGVMNRVHGPPEDQMFDIKRRWVIGYDLPDDADRAEGEKVRACLSIEIEKALLVILEEQLPVKAQAVEERFAEERRSFEARFRDGKFWRMPSRLGLAVCVVPERIFAIAYDAIRDKNLDPPVPSHHLVQWERQFGVDSVAFASPGKVPGPPGSIVEITTTGIVRAASAWIDVPDGRSAISASAVEDILVTSLPRWFRSLRELDASPPWRVGISLFGVSGTRLMVANRSVSPRTFEDPENLLCVDPVVVRSESEFVDRQTAAQVLKPAFDSIWRAFGFPQSWSFGTDGTWNPYR